MPPIAAMDRNEMRSLGPIPGTGITLYESAFPQPGVVWLRPFTTDPLATRDPESKSTAEQFGEYDKNREQHGWIIRALGPEKEQELVGRDLRTKSRLSLLFQRIASGQKTWVDPTHSPYGGRTGRQWSVKAGWAAWIADDCLPWIIIEGSKLGLNFAVREETGDYTAAQHARALVTKYVSDPESVSCVLKPERGKGIRLSAQVLGVPLNVAIDGGAEGLFQAYMKRFREGAERRELHEAYHRILLHRFLRRSRLTPPPSRGRAFDPVGSAVERRANLLQARRIFVFNESGCPVSLNQRALEYAGISLDPESESFRMFAERAPTIPIRAHEWTNWLYKSVLEKEPSECVNTDRLRRAHSRLISDLSGLARAGYLG